MDVASMMTALQSHDAAKRVASGIRLGNGNGMQTVATAITGAGKTTASGISGQAKSGAAAGAGASTASDTSTISSNDFLTLLVAEMKNQDPTQPTDPNAYIQQLVGVNSLQQLIAINGELGASTSATK